MDVTIDHIKNSFREYKRMYELFKVFNKTISGVKLNLILSICRVFNLFRLNIPLKWLSSSLYQKNYKNIMAIAFSKNQLEVLQVVKDSGIECDSILFGVKSKNINSHVYIANWKIVVMAFTSFNLYRILKTAGEDDFLKLNLVRVFKLIGCHQILETLNKDIDLIINFNDHMPYSVMVFDFAKRNSIKTVYIQHAPVSSLFPSLYHDYNVLFSQDSKDKYDASANVKIITLFDFRFINAEPFKPKNISKNQNLSNSILICPNMLDDIESVWNLVNHIRYSYDVTLRLHPRDKRNKWLKLGVKISSTESVWEDLATNDIIITNESAIVLEALYFNKLVYKAAFFSKSLDNYGYIEKKLILREYKDPERLIESIINRKIDYDTSNLKYFIGDFSNKEDKILKAFKSFIN